MAEAWWTATAAAEFVQWAWIAKRRQATCGKRERAPQGGSQQLICVQQTLAKLNGAYRKATKPILAHRSRAYQNLQLLDGEPPVFRSFVKDAIAHASNDHNFIQFFWVQGLVIEGESQIDRPGKEQRSRADNALAFLRFGDTMGKTAITPQLCRIRRTIIEQRCMLFTDHARFHFRTFSQGHRRPKKRCLDGFARNAWRSIEQIKTAHPFETSHFLVIRFRLLAFVRNSFLGLGPFVQRVGQLAIVHQEWGDAHPMVLQHLFQGECPYRRTQTYAQPRKPRPLAQMAARGLCSADDVGDRLQSHGIADITYSNRAIPPFLCAHKYDDGTQGLLGYRRAHTANHPEQRRADGGLANRHSDNADHRVASDAPNRAKRSRAQLVLAELSLA